LVVVVTLVILLITLIFTQSTYDDRYEHSKGF
jgi:hypothetical protein